MGHSRTANQLKSVFVLALVLMFFPVTALAATDEYVFLLKGRGNVFWKIIKDGVEEAATKNGVTAIVLNTDDDQTPEAQLNICQSVLSRRPKVLVLGATTGNVGIECYKKATAAGVIIADIDGNVSPADAKAANLDLAFSVTSNNVEIGALAAQQLAKTTTKQNPRVLVLKGLPGNIVSEQRTNGFVEELKRRLPDAVVVATPTTDWDRLKGMNISIDTMKRDSELDYIFSTSDVMALGAVEAVRVADKLDRVKVIGVDGVADARKAILSGRMEFSVAQLPFLMGKRAVELAIESTRDKLSGYLEFTPTPVLTREVLEKNSHPDLQYVR